MASCEKEPIELCVECISQDGYVDSYCASPVSAKAYKKSLESVGWQCKYK